MGHRRGSTTAERHYIVPEKQVIADHLEPMERFLDPVIEPVTSTHRQSAASRRRRLKGKAISAKE